LRHGGSNTYFKMNSAGNVWRLYVIRDSNSRNVCSSCVEPAVKLCTDSGDESSGRHAGLTARQRIAVTHTTPADAALWHCEPLSACARMADMALPIVSARCW
jgi:hypothetical protein